MSPRVQVWTKERFEGRVDKIASGCWLWNMYVGADGYGHTFYRGRNARAHCLAYELYIGPIPSGYEVDHLCKIRSCCNPAHLEAVTPRENTLRSNNPAAINARKTHCKNGHELAGNNLVPDSYGRRRCRECLNAWYAAKAAKRSARKKSTRKLGKWTRKTPRSLKGWKR